jgi:hypothetical protein
MSAAPAFPIQVVENRAPASAFQIQDPVSRADLGSKDGTRVALAARLLHVLCSKILVRPLTPVAARRISPNSRPPGVPYDRTASKPIRNEPITLTSCPGGDELTV